MAVLGGGLVAVWVLVSGRLCVWSSLLLMRKAQHAWRTSLIVPFPLEWFFYVAWHPISAARTKRAHPALKLWLVTCFSYALHPKSGSTLAFSRAVKSPPKKWQLTYAPDARNLSESCHVSSRSDPSLSHHAYQNTTWAWHAGQRGEIHGLSLTLRQTDSQPGRHTD